MKSITQSDEKLSSWQKIYLLLYHTCCCQAPECRPQIAASLAAVLSGDDAGAWNAAGRQLWEICCPTGHEVDIEAAKLLAAARPCLAAGIANVLCSENATPYAKGKQPADPSPPPLKQRVVTFDGNAKKIRHCVSKRLLVNPFLLQHFSSMT